MDDVFRIYAAATRGVARAAWKVTRLASRTAAEASLSRKASRQSIMPGQLDYRGVLDDRSRAARINGEFPVGYFLSPARGSLAVPMGIPEPAVRLNTCVVGPPGAGKTRHVIVPWIVAAVRCGYSVVCIDVKGDMLDLVRERVRAEARPLGIRPRSLDYTRPSSSMRWSWLSGLDSDRAIDSAVTSIVGKAPPPQTDPYFFHMDSQILRGLLELVRVSPNRLTMTTTTLLRTLKDQAAWKRR